MKVGTVKLFAPTVVIVWEPGVTAADAILPDVPLIDPVTVSVAVIVKVPLAGNVALNVPTPETIVASAGSVAPPLVEVKWIVPV